MYVILNFKQRGRSLCSAKFSKTTDCFFFGGGGSRDYLSSKSLMKKKLSKHRIGKTYFLLTPKVSFFSEQFNKFIS